MNDERCSGRTDNAEPSGSARRSLGRLMIILAIGAFLSLLMISGTGLAQQRTPDSPQEINDDGGTAEVGVEWITDWPGTADDRANWYYSAVNLYNELGNAGWVKRFNYGNTLAWETDFKRAAAGGYENYYIDSVDLGMIGTHGSGTWDSFWNKSLSSVYFSTNNADWHLSPGDAYRSFGDNDLEWLAFDSCSVLDDNSVAYWHATFNGLHLMAGFANTMYVVYPGDGGAWGDQMQKKGWWIFGHGAKTVTQAWFTATDDQQPSGVRARVVAEELDSYNDYIWGQGYVSPDYPNNGYFWYWDHVAGTPAPLPLAEPIGELPVLRLVPPVVDENYVLNIGNAFGLTSEILKSPEGDAFYMVGGDDDERQVRVDAISGAFYYQDLGELWTDPERPRSLPASAREAYALTLTFLAQHDNLPGVFSFDDEIEPTVKLESVTETASPEETERRPTATNDMNYATSFMRTVTIDGAGTKLSIVGPGSRQNVYLGDGGEVIGLKGGWRPYSLETQRATTPIRSAEDAWQAFMDNPDTAVAQPPRADEYVLSDVTPPTLAYYEQPSTVEQAELIPVWVFVADLYVDDGAPARSADALYLMADDAMIYLPAAADDAALPQVTITSPISGTVLMPGERVELAGEATGGVAPYTYLWTSSVDGELGTDATIPDVLPSPDTRAGGFSPNVITLQVTDANGQTATAEVEVTVMTSLYMPAVAKPD